MGKTIGLTGSVATGKSTVSNMIQQAGIPLVDADVAARKVVEPGTEGLKEIVAYFGGEILLADGTLDRAKLGEIIFKDKEKREKLNEITHPRVKDYMLEARERFFRAGEELVFFDIPLLFESHLESLVDQIVVVWTTPETELKRLMERNNLTKEDALRRIESQMGIDEKARKADFVIDNNESLEKTQKQVYTFIERFVKNK
ncbi:dephospho-CoA kinase [Listeria monocytogenes]|uniref:Dephospho-CoA kinase n=1 Tax=Listeria monocytogenes serotype 4a (strain M7) TaxID=1030009 RepID=A0A0E0UWE5_LISMM|nr:dephospho-CoA kinase [Listeria monocytogenes]ACK39354.1 dephospho-CoA kinase [Listeria monocytogenes HCC23]AEH92654.1 dephospho-CoA kinase [Listeria monocytogenes M7]AKS54167.1 dephospho-CoA kinase [Listeria monocytogenes]EAC6409353.1 dephospho-CoA kinase [Listeria monocytogenes]EAC6860108.1 dephospho-CoA kinase [Listeria monocytogenes]